MDSAGDAVWVSNRGRPTITRLDIASGRTRRIAAGGSGRRVGERVEVSINPLKLAVDGDSAYAISLAEGRLDRVRVSAGR